MVCVRAHTGTRECGVYLHAHERVYCCANACARENGHGAYLHTYRVNVCCCVLCELGVCVRELVNVCIHVSTCAVYERV